MQSSFQTQEPTFPGTHRGSFPNAEAQIPTSLEEKTEVVQLKLEGNLSEHLKRISISLTAPVSVGLSLRSEAVVESAGRQAP